MGRLDGKVCFITGTGGGQGAAAARLFEAEGATVVGCDIAGDPPVDLGDPDQARDWRFTIRNELDLIFTATKAAWPHLIARGGGHVINTASVSAHRGALFQEQA